MESATRIPDGRARSRPEMAGGALALTAQVLEMSSDAIAVLDSDGYLAKANQVFLRLSGYGRGEIAGLHLRALFPGASHKLCSAENRSRRWAGEIKMMRRDGGIILLSLAVTPVKDGQGAFVGFVVRMTPIAGQERPVGAASDTRALQLGTLEHKLRNVLTLIIGHVQMMDTNGDDRVLRGRLALLVQDAARSGVELLDEMRRYPVR